ncbi:MAG TPA: cytochrome c [Candidatus Tectomicrobia bacterium]|nr:cytochrome c [Candidatus Tectomicrobia bacterium]
MKSNPDRLAILKRRWALHTGWLVVSCMLLAMGCRQDMQDQPRYEPLEASDFFADGRASRPLVEGTVAQGQLRLSDHLYAGRVNDVLADTLPMPLTRQLLERGQERYNIYCSPCHDRAGSGQGVVVRRGFRRPSSFHIARLREAPIGYFYEVITNGFGAMMDYAAQVTPHDRWAIAAYIRALQLSQHATLADVPIEERQLLQELTP